MTTNQKLDATTPTADGAASRANRTPAVWLATGLGLGFSPVMPGTVGAVWGLPLAWCLAQLPWPAAQAVAIAAICALGVPLCTAAVRDLGGAKDPGCVVFDEIASLPITFFLVGPLTPGVMALGFLLHRVFDITKPPPARQLERLPTGLGVMADDWAAGVFSCLSLHALLWLDAGRWLGG